MKARKLVKTAFCGEIECEDWIKDKTEGANSRCIPFDQPKEIKEKCIHCGKEINEFSGESVMVGCDGDSCCSRECKVKHDEAKDFFYDEVIHDDRKFAAWMDSTPDSEIAAMRPVLSHEETILKRINSIK